jgi:hypothetical protein
MAEENFRDKIRIFVSMQLYKTEESSVGRCTKFSLRHIGALKGQDVQVYDVGEGQLSEEGISALAVQVANDAKSDSEGLGGTQRYQICAFFSKTGDEPRVRTTVRIYSEGSEYDDDGNGVDSEPPTKAGFMAQLMRHNENKEKMALGALGHVVNSLLKNSERVEKENESLRKNQFEVFETMQELMDMKADRNRKNREADNIEEMKRTGFEKLLQYAPDAINAMAGKEIIPNPQNSLMTIITGFMKSVTSDQLAELSKVLKPDQLETIVALHQLANEPDPKEQIAVQQNGKNGN